MAILKDNKKKIMALMEFNLKVDVQDILDIIEDFEQPRDDEKLFSKLAEIEQYAKTIEYEVEKFEAMRSLVKERINDKAKELYGKTWAAIKGKGFKITRFGSGSVYSIVPEKVDKKFVVTSYRPNTKAITDYMKDTSKLPEGVALNKERKEVIRINLNDHEDSEA